MTSRERVLTAIDHRQPDRIPVDFWAVPQVYARLADELGLDGRDGVLDWAGADLGYFDGPAGAAQRQARALDGTVRDHWGVARKPMTVEGRRRDGTPWRWTYKHLVESPLAGASSVAEIERHAWPTADLWDYSGVGDACRAIRATGRAVVIGADRLDRTAQLKPAMYLRGVERFMTDLALAPALAECILEHVAAYYLAYNRRLFQAAEGQIDIFFMGDDMGTQASTWVSPEMYRRFFQKRLAAYCALAHEFGARTMYHTCGNVTSLVGEFVDAGLDVLQSLQPAALGDRLVELKRRYGARLAFQGGVDIQNVLPHARPNEVRDSIRDLAKVLGPGGGYIFGTAHNILPDAPTENVVALVEAYRQFGAY